jgi:hypothetical protein
MQDVNTGHAFMVRLAALALLVASALAPWPALAEAADARAAGAAQTTAECKAELAADYGPLGKGRDIVRRLYPQFDPSTLLVKAEPSYALLDCDFLLRRKPVISLAVVLRFPSAQAMARKAGTSASESIFDDDFRFEIADLRGDSLDKASVARNPDALTRETLAGQADERALPVGRVRLERTTFRLNESESAVAVRFAVETIADGYGAYLSEYDELASFRPDGQGLALILMVPLRMVTTQVHCDEDDENCGGFEEEKYIVRVAKHKTRGLYDLVVKNVSHPRREPPDTYQWNGKDYVPAAPEKK